MGQAGFVLDVSKCTGCDACRLACTIENRLPPGSSFRRVTTFNEPHYPGIPAFHLSLACNHCRRPACAAGCPAQAIVKDRSNGVVRLLPDRCIGCRYCGWLCPSDALHFNKELGVMEKCTFCAERLPERRPACVVACPAGALQYESENEESAAAELPAGFPDRALRPAVRFAGKFPHSPASLRQGTAQQPVAVGSSKIHARREWALVAFTLVAALLVAWLAAVILGFGKVHRSVFLLAGGGAMLMSTAHLGRRVRAPRAILNWSRSWLSREILFFGCFLALAAAWFLTNDRAVAWLSLAAGFAAVVSMDALYAKIPRLRKPLPLHSSSITLTAVFWLGILAFRQTVVAGAGLLKIFLYLKASSGRRAVPADAFRLLIGLVLPMGLMMAVGPEWWPLTLLSAVAGEIIDRSRFYSEMDVLTPQNQSLHDLHKMVGR